jgi:hypothetical protein
MKTENEDKSYCLKMCPEIKAKRIKNKDNIRYEIKREINTIAVSFVSEDVAWSWAKVVLDRQLLNKLSQ